MPKTSDRDVVPGAGEREQLAVRMLAEAYKRVTVGDRDWLATCKIDCQQVLQVGRERGLHRRRGVKGRLHVARTVRVRARRVLGAAAVIGVVTGLCLGAVMGLTRSGDSGIPSYHKPENPFLHTTPRQPDSGTGALGNRRPPRSVSLGLSVPVPARAASVLSTQSVPQASSPVTSPIPSSSASPSPSQSAAPSVSPSASASPSPSQSPIPSPSLSTSQSPTPSAAPSVSASTSAAAGSSLSPAGGLPASSVRRAGWP